MIAYKKPDLIVQFPSLDLYLRNILKAISDFVNVEFHRDPIKSVMVMTSLIRPQDYGSVHKDGRGADFDFMPPGLSLDECYKLELFANTNFGYGDGIHKVLLAHSRREFLSKDPTVIDDQDFHFHSQVAPKDKRR